MRGKWVIQVGLASTSPAYIKAWHAVQGCFGVSSNVRKYQTEMETNFHGAKTGRTASGYWASHPLLAIVDDQMKRPTTHEGFVL